MSAAAMRAAAMRAARRVIALSLLVVFAGRAHAGGEAAGTAAGSFLSVGAGASVLSMSGATLASGRDLAAASWNVASLARVDALEFALSHSPLPGGATQDWLGAGGRLGTGATRWGLSALFHQEGDFEGRDALNQPTGALSVSDLALSAHVARPLGEFLSAGFGAEWVHESLAGSNGSGLAFDAGLRAQAGSIGMALAARHIGGAMDYSGVKYDMPAVIAGGVSWTDAARGLRVAADFESPTHYYGGVRLGGEWLVREWMAVRAGYRSQIGGPSTEQLSGASFGFGSGVGNVWMDYAYTPDGAEGAGQHRLGLTFRPGRVGSEHAHEARPAVERVAPAPRVTRAPRVQAEPEAAERVTKPATKPVATQAAAPETRPDWRPIEPAASTAPIVVTPIPSAPAAKPEPVSAPVAAKPIPSAPAAKSELLSAPVTPKPIPSAPAAKPEPVSVPVTPKPSTPSAPVPAVLVAPSEVRPATEQPKPAPTPAVSPVIVRPTSVVVANGETLATIARRWDTTPAAIMMTNDLVREQVAPGTRLKLPPARKR